MILKNMGMALRFCIPQMIGRKVGEFWELIKPLVDFKYEVSDVFQLLDLEEILNPPQAENLKFYNALKIAWFARKDKEKHVY